MIWSDPRHNTRSLFAENKIETALIKAADKCVTFCFEQVKVKNKDSINHGEKQIFSTFY